jgi:hypothetical protein
MTTSPAEPVDNDQSGSDNEKTDQGISDDQLPEDLQPGPDNPLASPDGNISEAPKPNEDDDAVPQGEQPPGEPSIG